LTAIAEPPDCYKLYTGPKQDRKHDAHAERPEEDTNTMKNIVLCSSHPMLIAGFRQVVEQSGEFSMTLCEDAAGLCEHLLTGRADVALADASCGVTLELLSELRAKAPRTPIVLWLDNANTEFISQAINVGVMGVLRKNSAVDLCLQCLRQVAAGEIWIERELNNKLLRTRTIRLTPRERQLMTMLAQGLRNKELAYRLGITEGTVKVYLSHLYEKVGASDRFELALLALKNLAMDQSTASRNLESVSISALPGMMPGVLSFEEPAATIQ
jgi:two-component system, NarL family, nitrate/nitrite response regulator NarL